MLEHMVDICIAQFREESGWGHLSQEVLCHPWTQQESLIVGKVPECCLGRPSCTLQSVQISW